MWKDVGLEKITTREQLKSIQNTQSSSSTSATPLSLTNTSLPCLAVLILGPLSLSTAKLQQRKVRESRDLGGKREG
ncbi:hypothetical protein JG687_00006503 [Phytophthora cactorum]|uniref:Uncharacterized protein n=1 Tax=Phytophthora cactorum TaxID=29920 RepID=A0A8T1UJ58_9STRA|nr:hypothetical protein JG687_00006503 [Phytophthora cactorum]